ncbi:hypothetical protein [Fodinicola acaciae]|uniref:hypothetical protein n=1 Tax=Fodinicola acaciae TaxID=2681555 RepID=UPI0013D72634|nr:hypothetical protein [Fodinicola acaciae]
MRRLLIAVAVLACVAVLAVIAVVTFAVTRGGNVPVPAALKPEGCTIKVGGDTISLALDRAQNASTIAAVGFQRGDGLRGVTVALATALQESKLENVPGGDRDSIGLFQQRPSQGWGTPEQLADPRYAATAFYKRLEKVDGWEKLPLHEAAQKVQRSADGSAYAPWEFEATTLATAYSGQAAGTVSCLVRHKSGGTDDLSTQLRGDLRGDVSTKAVSIRVGTATGSSVAPLLVAPIGSKDLPAYRRLAYWLVAHAQTYRIETVAYKDVRWSASDGSWTTVTPDNTGRIAVQFK